MDWDSKELVNLGCTPRDIEFLMKLKPILNMVEKGTPISRASGSLYGGKSTREILYLLSRGKQLEDDGNEIIDLKGEDKCAMIFYVSYNYCNAKLINDLSSVIYNEAVKKKSWKAASELLKMRFSEFNAKSGLAEDLDVIKKTSKIDVQFIDTTASKTQTKRLEKLEEEAIKDVA